MSLTTTPDRKHLPTLLKEISSPRQDVSILDALRENVLLKKPKKRRRQAASSRINYNSYTVMSIDGPTTNRDLLERSRVKQRSASRQQRFEAKLERIATNRSADAKEEQLKTYESEVDYLRRQLVDRQRQNLKLQKTLKLIKTKQLEEEVIQLRKQLEMQEGMLQHSRKIIDNYEQKQQLPQNKKTILKKLREDNMALEGVLNSYRGQLSKTKQRLVVIEKQKFIFQQRMNNYKKQLQAALADRSAVRTRRETHTESSRELNIFKRKLNDAEGHLERIKQENYKLQKEAGTLRHELAFKQTQLEGAVKKYEQVLSQKASIETTLIARMHDLENNRRELERQKSTRPYQTKTKERKKVVSREEVENICRKLRYRFIRSKIQHKKIAQLIDGNKFKDAYRPTQKQIQSLLSNDPFNLDYDEQLLFSKYLMENNSPLYDDDSDEEKTNSTPMIKAIMEKVIDKYEIFSPASESDMSESLRKLFDHSGFREYLIRVTKPTNGMIEIADFNKGLRDNFLQANEATLQYMKLKSFELTGSVQAIHAGRLIDYFKTRQPRKNHQNMPN